MRRWWWVPGLVLVVVGVVVLVSQDDPASADFGWFAYTPLSDPGTDFSDFSDFSGGSEVLFLTRARIWGACAVLVGLLALAGGVGYRLGRRTTSA